MALFCDPFFSCAEEGRGLGNLPMPDDLCLRGLAPCIDEEKDGGRVVGIAEEPVEAKGEGRRRYSVFSSFSVTKRL